MNRKYIVGFIAGVMALSLTLVGCGDKSKDGGKEDLVKEKVEQKVEQKPQEESKATILEFSTKTILDKDIDSKIFKDYKLTMVNLWATSCPPCVAEMPDIQKLYEEEKQNGINVIGVVADVRDEKDSEYKDRSRDIVNKAGVKYENLIADKNLALYFSEISQYVPTTVFVDSNGQVIGKPIVGPRTKEEYKSIIQERLSSLK